MNLAEWAYAQGIHVTAAYRWREGTLPVPARKAGRLTLVSPDTAADLYAWVSSHGQKAGLGRQVARPSGWAAQPGLPVTRAAAGVGPWDGAG